MIVGRRGGFPILRTSLGRTRHNIPTPKHPRENVEVVIGSIERHVGVVREVVMRMPPRQPKMESAVPGNSCFESPCYGVFCEVTRVGQSAECLQPADSGESPHFTPRQHE